MREFMMSLADHQDGIILAVSLFFLIASITHGSLFVFLAYALVSLTMNLTVQGMACKGTRSKASGYIWQYI